MLRPRQKRGMEPSARAKVFSEAACSRPSVQARRQPSSRATAANSTGRPSVCEALGGLTSDA